MNKWCYNIDIYFIITEVLNVHNISVIKGNMTNKKKATFEQYKYNKL